ncbi:hypothetical protein RF11_01705 [Thelohanellus kitauei]|uniref:Uncharacterized protein n=1 Tax=Thelohanellus kitauei TaxID=669202 RepID=A0A0C2NET0_THEKT|nr:hypothetical protein RF11_01705 [Thelohanellus kitauei]
MKKLFEPRNYNSVVYLFPEDIRKVEFQNQSQNFVVDMGAYDYLPVYFICQTSISESFITISKCNATLKSTFKNTAWIFFDYKFVLEKNVEYSFDPDIKIKQELGNNHFFEIKFSEFKVSVRNKGDVIKRKIITEEMLAKSILDPTSVQTYFSNDYDVSLKQIRICLFESKYDPSYCIPKVRTLLMNEIPLEMAVTFVAPAGLIGLIFIFGFIKLIRWGKARNKSKGY